MLGGLTLGLWLGFHRRAGEVADPILGSLYSIPKITLYPVILLIFGLGLSAKVAFGAIHGLFPVAIFTMNGIRQVPAVHLKTARVLNLSSWATVSIVLMPAAAAEIAAGLRIVLEARRMRESRRMRYYSFMEKVAKITGLKAPSLDRAYWLARSPQERLAAVEELRQQYLASRHRVEQRLQRVCRVTQLHRG